MRLLSKSLTDSGSDSSKLNSFLLTALCLKAFGDIVLDSFRSPRDAICVDPRATLGDRQRDTAFILEADILPHPKRAEWLPYSVAVD